MNIKQLLLSGIAMLALDAVYLSTFSGYFNKVVKQIHCIVNTMANAVSGLCQQVQDGQHLNCGVVVVVGQVTLVCAVIIKKFMAVVVDML